MPHPAAIPILACAALAAAFAPVTGAADATKQWGQWRGPLGTGVAPHGSPPVEWSEETNVRWKTPIPGAGHSTPVAWGDRIYLTTAVEYGEPVEAAGGDAHGAHHNVTAARRLEFVVLAIDRRSGEIAWKRVVHRGRPHDSTHETGSWASNSPVTDGKRIYAFFGSNGVYCLDRDGTLVWKADLGEMRIKHGHGEGSSPALHGRTLVVNWDHEGDSRLVAFDARTGAVRWEAARDEGTSWSSPLIVEHAGRRQVIVAATRRVRSYDLATGRPVWECGGLSGNVVATPVAGAGMVFVANSYETRNMLAIRLDGAAGDITGSDAVVWRLDRLTPYVPSPLLYDDTLYFLKHYQGYLSAVDAASGEKRYPTRRLDRIGNVYASLVGAAGRVYVTDLNGTTLVVRHGPSFEVLARNRLDDSFAASPAIVGDEILLRGSRSLYSLGAPRD